MVADLNFGKEEVRVKAMAGTIPCSRPAMSIEPFAIEYCENNHKVITKANQRKEKYHKEPMETENKANCLKRGPRLKRW